MLPIRTILHATDFSDCSDAAFRVACSLARDYGARLIVVNVTPRGCGRHPGELEDLLHRCQMPDLRVRLEHQLAEGNVTEQVLRVADEARCDMIVMGTHNRSGFDRAVLGSVAESVLRGATCPVLVVKTPHREPVTPAGLPAETVAPAPRRVNAVVHLGELA
jgi:nucleotide-binding universal stress UspA family protein